MVRLVFSMKLFAISSISEVVSEHNVLFEASLGLKKEKEIEESPKAVLPLTPLPPNAKAVLLSENFFLFFPFLREKGRNVESLKLNVYSIKTRVVGFPITL